MSEPIRAGDLVMVIRPSPCCHRPAQGTIFVVEMVEDSYYDCMGCHAHVEDVVAKMSGKWLFYAVSRLKRIPPLGELEGVDEKETLHA